MKKRIVIFVFFILLLIGCSNIKNEKYKNTNEEKFFNQNYEEENVDMNKDKKSEKIDISSYLFKIPNVFLEKNNSQMIEDFSLMEKDFYCSSQEFSPSNDKLGFVPYGGGYNNVNNTFIFSFMLINLSNKEIDSLEFSLNVYVNDSYYEEFKEKRITISNEDIGGFPTNTVIPYILRYENINISLETREISAFDFKGTNVENLVIRYKK